MPIYSEMSLGFRSRLARRPAWALSSASRRRAGDTQYVSRSTRLAWAAVMPPSIMLRTSFAGRMPVSAPQEGVTPVTSLAARKKDSFSAR